MRRRQVVRFEAPGRAPVGEHRALACAVDQHHDGAGRQVRVDRDRRAHTDGPQPRCGSRPGDVVADAGHERDLGAQVGEPGGGVRPGAAGRRADPAGTSAPGTSAPPRSRRARRDRRRRPRRRAAGGSRTLAQRHADLGGEHGVGADQREVRREARARRCRRGSAPAAAGVTSLPVTPRSASSARPSASSRSCSLASSSCGARAPAAPAPCPAGPPSARCARHTAAACAGVVHPPAAPGDPESRR